MFSTPQVGRGSARWTVVSRLLWPGIGRMVIEESRRLPARLLVYRESPRQVYAVPSADTTFLRRAGETGRWTPWLTRATLLFNADRGTDATIDLDLIFRAARELDGPVLYHDQFAGLTGFLRRLDGGPEYAIYVHETSLGDRQGVMDLTLRSPVLRAPVRIYDRTIIRRAKLVFTNSLRNQQVLLEEGVASTVAYPGSSPIDRLPVERERFVLAVGVWERTKKPDVYAELARRTKVPVFLVGMWARPDEHEAFLRTHADVVAQNLVRVTGAVSETELDRLSRAASLYVRFSYAERGPGQGGIQALGYGIPVMTNPELAISEILTDGVDGYVVQNEEEAARRILEFFDSAHRMRAMSEAAWATSRKYDWDAHTTRIREGLERMI